MCGQLAHLPRLLRLLQVGDLTEGADVIWLMEHVKWLFGVLAWGGRLRGLHRRACCERTQSKGMYWAHGGWSPVGATWSRATVPFVIVHCSIGASIIQVVAMASAAASRGSSGVRGCKLWCHVECGCATVGVARSDAERLLCMDPCCTILLKAAASRGCMPQDANAAAQIGITDLQYIVSAALSGCCAVRA